MAKTKSTSPKGGKKACLCEDGTYHVDCCKGETINQGIGNLGDGVSHNVNNLDTTRVINAAN